ncbi:MAG: MurR/RpiR family transcriptional regulator [Oscillospiraceae bacterium]|nr:MurR/RpiR family transcriptional regulator [Oscillospiraceae bacterium]
MENDVLSAIEAASGSFSKSQRLIAEYISKNYDKAAFMTAGKLGRAIGVSESTVVRFAADLGYDGYPEMRKALQELIKNRLTFVQRIEVSKDLLESTDLPSAVLHADIEKLKCTLDELDRDDFNKAVDVITGARNIYVLGMRSSAALATFLSFYLNLLFPGVILVSGNVAGDIFEQILRVGKEDVFIGISFPRYSKRTLKAMEYAGDRGATVIGITDNKNSFVAEHSDIKLCAKSDMVSFLDSLVAPMSLINALILALSEKTGDDISKSFARLEDIWAEDQVYETNGQ